MYEYDKEKKEQEEKKKKRHKKEEYNIITYRVNDNGVIDGLIIIDENGIREDWKPNNDLNIKRLYEMRGMSLGVRNEIEDWISSGNKIWIYK